MKAAFRFVDAKFEEILGVLALVVVIALIFIGVVMRLGFHAGIPWQEELSRILYVLVVYLGASYGVMSNDHIRVSLVTELLPPRGKRVLGLITDLVWVVFNIWVIVLALDVYRSMRAFPGRSAVLSIPLHVVFLIVPIGFALISLRIIQRQLRQPPAGVEPAQEA